MIKALIISISLVITLILGSYFMYDYKCTKGLAKETTLGLAFAMTASTMHPMVAYAFQQEALRIHNGRQIACGMKAEIANYVPQPIIDFLENE